MQGYCPVAFRVVEGLLLGFRRAITLALLHFLGMFSVLRQELIRVKSKRNGEGPRCLRNSLEIPSKLGALLGCSCFISSRISAMVKGRKLSPPFKN